MLFGGGKGKQGDRKGWQITMLEGKGKRESFWEGSHFEEGGLFKSEREWSGKGRGGKKERGNTALEKWK